jgi:dUTP pyrophosphatase|tara:strand:+ start:867 stop:1301 length:435 start_codon:yes stop_codon:yes gene_type:complete
MKVKIVNKSSHKIPEYSTTQSSGMDLRANLTEPVILKSNERGLFKTGLFLEIPDGYEAQVRPRSGLALKKGITVLNSPGTIDADYRGEIGIILINLSQEDFIVNNGERIAQLVFSSYSKADLLQVEGLEESTRGVGGFGSTGVK